MRYNFLAFVSLVSTLAAWGQDLNLRGSLTLTPRTAIDASGTLAYTVGNNSLSIVDVSDPDDPDLRGQTAPNVSQMTGIEVWNGYAYCAGQSQGLVVVNVSNPDQPQWVTNLALSSAARDVAVYDTLVAVATAGNVTLVGVRSPAQPHILTAYQHTASWIEFDGPLHLLHVGSSSGAFALEINTAIGGGDTTFSLSLFDQYGSEELTPLSLAAPYVSAVHGATVRVIRADNYTLAGQYTSTSNLNAIVARPGYCMIGLATGAVHYLDQRNPTPVFLDGVGVPSAVSGLAFAQSGSQPLVVAATASGVTVLDYDALTADPGDFPALPGELSLSAFPNPFNSSTELTLSVLQSGMYELKVYDALGRETISRAMFLSGEQRVRLYFSDLSAGSYFSRLSGNGQQSSLRLIYLP